MPAATTSPGTALPLRSVAQMLAAMFCFAVVDALAKSITAHYPANEITFFRMLFGLAPALLLAARARQGGPLLRTRHWRAHLERSIALIATLGLFFAGLRYVPLSEAVALAYTETLFVIVLAPLVLKSGLRRRELLAAVIGFTGIVLVVRPGGATASLLGPALILLSAIFGALSVIQIKRIGPTDDASLIVLYSTLISAGVTGISLLFAWQTPSFGHLGILALLGVAAGTGQLLMTSAFRHGEVSVLAPFNYTSIVWATLFGYVLWGESVGLVPLLGIVLIVGSSVAVAMRRKEPDQLGV
jgi:drug/metabolite transporter (DMT)-like permease